MISQPANALVSQVLADVVIRIRSSAAVASGD